MPSALRDRSFDKATRMFNARSGGGILRPSDETNARVFSKRTYSGWHAAHWCKCAETSCISTPVTAPSRYEENRARTSVHFMTAPPLQFDPADWSMTSAPMPPYFPPHLNSFL